MRDKILSKILAISVVVVIITSCIALCIAVDNHSTNNASLTRTEEFNATEIPTPFYVNQFPSNDTITMHVHPYRHMLFNHEIETPMNEDRFLDPLARDERFNHTEDYLGYSPEESMYYPPFRVSTKNASHSNVSLSSNTYYVNPGESIQDAVDNASAGDTIIVRDGTYTENINVNKPFLTIKSENGSAFTTINGGGSGDVVSITANNVTIKGFTITGSGYPDAGLDITTSGNRIISSNISNNNYFGIYLGYSSSDNTISSNNISNNVDGIFSLYSSNNNTISSNNISNNVYGIFFRYSSNDNTISSNNISNSSRCGVYLYYSSNNTISSNIFTNDGLFVQYSYNNVVENNTVNEKPLVYLDNALDVVVNDAGEVIVVNSSNIIIKNLNLSNTCVGIEFWNTSNNRIEGNIIQNNNWGGIELWDSSNIAIYSNNLSNNNDGIDLLYSSNTAIYSNNLSNNNERGIYFYSSSNTAIYSNNLSNNKDGIDLFSSNNNTIYSNNLSNNGKDGIYLSDSKNNIISSNIISSNNYRGIYLWDSSNNSIYHNNLINNTVQAYDNTGTNSWDNGYPSGGNYWSDYNGSDTFSGPYQNITGSDGIGDTPYNISGGAGAKDNYPLMEPWGGEEIEYWAVVIGVTHHLDPYEYADKDAMDMYNALLSSSNWKDNHIRLLINEDATKKNIQSNITNWLGNNISENDICLIYYSAHGFSVKNDADPDGYEGAISTYDDVIWDDTLEEWLEYSTTNNTVVILDACNSGAFVGDLEKEGRVIITSCSAEKVTLVHKIFENELFSFHIIQGLWGAADSNRDVKISAEELFIFAKRRTSVAMDPQISDKYEGDLNILLLSEPSPIQKKVNQANTWDVIEIPPGIYNEHVIINKSLTITGNNVIIDGANKFGCIFVNGCDVKIDGLILKNSKYGIYTEFSNNITISNNIISNNTNGVCSLSSNKSTIIANIIQNNSNAIYLCDTNNNGIRDNVLFNNNGSTSISGNGIYLISSQNNTIAHNTISENGVGLVNDILNHKGNGIGLSFSSNNIIVSNIILNNMEGISVMRGNNNKLMNNTLISNNDKGIWLFSHSKDNFIYHNNLLDNNQNAYDDTPYYYDNSWDNGYPSGGNYWSDFDEESEGAIDEKSGPNQDEDGSDGIVDTPYDISGDAGAQDRYPFMNENGWLYPYTKIDVGVTSTITPANPDDIVPYLPPEYAGTDISDSIVLNVNITDNTPDNLTDDAYTDIIIKIGELDIETCKVFKTGIGFLPEVDDVTALPTVSGDPAFSRDMVNETVTVRLYVGDPLLGVIPSAEPAIFDTGKGTYPSISGTHTGTIEPSSDINVSKLYTYPCVGTGGHTKSIELYENETLIASGVWKGYQGDWHNITLTPAVTLLKDHEYRYVIETGSYPQIIHAHSKAVTGGTITCTEFTDANGKTYTNWIPAIRLGGE